MRTRTALFTGVTAAVAVGWLVAGNPASVQGQAPANPAFAAVPGEKGGLDITGPYDVVADWPKPMTALPRSRRLELGVGPGRLRREPESRLRRAAR